MASNDTEMLWEWTFTRTAARIGTENIVEQVNILSEVFPPEVAELVLPGPASMLLEVTMAMPPESDIKIVILDNHKTVWCERSWALYVICKGAIHTQGNTSWSISVAPWLTTPDMDLTVQIRLSSVLHDPRSGMPPSEVMPHAPCRPDLPAFAHGPSWTEKRPLFLPCVWRTGAHTHDATLGSQGGTWFAFSNRTPIQNPAGLSITGHGLLVSTDEGKTWQSRLVPSTAVGPPYGGTVAPYMHVDEQTGRIFVDIFQPDPEHSVVSYSDDKGLSWDSGVVAGHNFDQSLTTGPPATSVLSGYENMVYRCARWLLLTLPAADHHGIGCHRSSNGGQSWEPTAIFAAPMETTPLETGKPCDVTTGPVEVDATGRLLVPFGYCKPYLAVSSDEGDTWDIQQVAPTSLHRLLNHPRGPALAVDSENNWYYAWTGEDRLPRMVTSSNAGQSWSSEVIVSPPGVAGAARIDIAADAVGVIALAYYGSDLGAAPRGDVFPSPIDPYWDGYLTLSTDALSEQPTFLTAIVNDATSPLARGMCRSVDGDGGCQEMGLIIAVDFDDGVPWAIYSDGCGAAWTTCESFDGDIGEGIVVRLVEG